MSKRQSLTFIGPIQLVVGPKTAPKTPRKKTYAVGLMQVNGDPLVLTYDSMKEATEARKTLLASTHNHAVNSADTFAAIQTALHEAYDKGHQDAQLLSTP